jgi:hypothetical protein
MADKPLPTHEDIETAFDGAPKSILDRLPDTTETRSARRNLKIAKDYAAEVIEKVKREG